jgi:hypothetical protein
MLRGNCLHQLADQQRSRCVVWPRRVLALGWRDGRLRPDHRPMAAEDARCYGWRPWSLLRNVTDTEAMML